MIEVEILACDKINPREGLIYIHDYNISDIDDYDIELKKEYNLLDLQKTTWIKTKNNTSTPLQLISNEKEPPKFIKIPGEQAKTKVCEYYERPMSCKTCLNMGT